MSDPRYHIDVSVVTRYLPEQSQPEQNRFAFAYTVTVSNNGELPAKLLSRHWVITDGDGHVQEVRGSPCDEGGTITAQINCRGAQTGCRKVSCHRAGNGVGRGGVDLGRYVLGLDGGQDIRLEPPPFAPLRGLLAPARLLAP